MHIRININEFRYFPLEYWIEQYIKAFFFDASQLTEWLARYQVKDLLFSSKYMILV